MKYGFQQCQDEDLTLKFRKLHIDIVNKISKFCKDNNLDIDEVHLDCDYFHESCKEGKWMPSSDSYMLLISEDGSVFLRSI